MQPSATPSSAEPCAPASLRPALDKRRPYISHHGASPLDNFNNVLLFDRAAETPPWNQRIACRHFALLYCEQLLRNPDFHPSDFFRHLDPREEDPGRLLELIDDISHYSRAWHMLPSHRFAEFLQQAFTQLLDREGPPWAVCVALTLNHAMALRLRVKTKEDGSQELVAQVYDPNRTMVHAIARVARPQDWGSEGRAHEFLGFLCADAQTPEQWAEVQNAYSTEIDPDTHITLYELAHDGAGQWVKRDTHCPLHTNWCTNSRVQLANTLLEDDHDLRDASLERFFQDPTVNALQDPQQLLEWPEIDGAVLQFILRGHKGVGQAQWQACWEQVEDPDLRVQLLRGHNAFGEHLLLSASQWNPAGLRWWLEMVARLPVQEMLQVLKINDACGYLVMEPWVMNQLGIEGTPWRSMLDAIQAERPELLREILTSMADDGTPMLAAYADDSQLPALREWGTLLPRLDEIDRHRVLLARDRNGISALYRAMLGKSPGWVALWGEWCDTLAAAQRTRLLNGKGPSGEHCLFTMARFHHRATLQAWIDVWRRLPEAHRADTLAGAQEAAPFVTALFRAMSGSQSSMSDPTPGCEAFIEQWGACLEAVPSVCRVALLRGTADPRTTALRQGLWTGHWPAVVAWAGLLRWVTPAERAALTQLSEDADLPLAQAVRDHAQKDPAAYHAALQVLRDTLPEKAWAWMQAQAPAQPMEGARTEGRDETGGGGY